MLIFTVAYLASAAALTIVMAYKFADLRRRWGSPRLWALCVLFLFAALTFAFAAPTTIGAVNRATGVPNVSALIVYSLVVGLAASNIALGLGWRYPPHIAWPKIRLIYAAYALIVAAMVALFAASDVPVERRTDFDTYYAEQPTVTAFLLVYLITTLVGMAGLGYLCVRWSNSDAVTSLPWLRRALRIFAAAAICPALFAAIKIVTVLTAAAGNHALDDLSTAAPVLNIVGVIVVVIGFPLPSWGPSLSNWRTFRTLRPLHRALAAANPAAVMVRPGKRFDPHHRVHRQRVELSDLRWTLAHRIDPAIGDTAREQAANLGISQDRLPAVTEAAQLRTALATSPNEARTETTADAPSPLPLDGHTTDLDWWLEVARAWNSRAVVALLTRHRATTQDPSPHTT